ncbi:MAG: helix-turn-helix transcriptional regulator [Dehalococcoidales bacterium]|nr:helix-turn-helix transcriptional regulator [Dehalococcoidales bacterium]
MHQKNIIGPKIKEARKNARLSQMELAARMQVLGIGIDRSAIAKVETGKRPISDIEIVAISEILNTQIALLFEDSKQWIIRESNKQ